MLATRMSRRPACLLLGVSLEKGCIGSPAVNAVLSANTAIFPVCADPHYAQRGACLKSKSWCRQSLCPHTRGRPCPEL